MNRPQAYPLVWPEGQPRTKSRVRSRFGVVGWQATRRLMLECRRFNAGDVVISTNVEFRNDGLPYARSSEPDDPGVALYFTKMVRGGAPREPFVIACDTYRTVSENVRAISKTVEAMRAIERYGATQLAERAFAGFSALPPRPRERPWHELLGVDATASNDAIRERWHELARKYHPDKGGDVDTFKVLSEAWARASKERGIG